MSDNIDPRLLELMVPRAKLVFNVPIFVWLTETKNADQYYYESWSPLFGYWKEGKSINEAVQAQEDFLKEKLLLPPLNQTADLLSETSAAKAVAANGPYVMVSWRTIEIELPIS